MTKRSTFLLALILTLGNLSYAQQRQASRAGQPQTPKLSAALLQEIENVTNDFDRRYTVFRENFRLETLPIGCNYWGRVVVTAQNMKSVGDKIWRIVYDNHWHWDENKTSSPQKEATRVSGVLNNISTIVSMRAARGVCLWKQPTNSEQEKNVRDGIEFELEYNFKDVEKNIADLRENLEVLKKNTPGGVK